MYQKINKSAVVSLQKRINDLVKHDLYIRVAALLDDAGVHPSALCGTDSITKALTEGPHAVPSPYIINAMKHLRDWKSGLRNRPEDIPKE